MGEMSKPLTAQLWDLLDDATERFMGIPKDERNTPEALKAAGEARGLADAVTVVVQPMLDEPNAAAKLAIKRMRARQAGEEMPPTPGYMSAEEARAHVRMRNERARAEAKAQARKNQAKAGESLLPNTGSTLSDEDIKVAIAQLGPTKVGQIQNGIKLEFGNEKLADLYDVSLDVITAIERDLN